MTTEERIQQLMTEVGPLVDAIDLVEREGESHWDIGFADGSVVSIAYEVDARKLSLSVDVGEPPAGDRFALYETLLAYNFLSTDTGGVRMAIDGGGGVVQMVDLFAIDLDATTLAGVLMNFLELSHEWRRIIERASDLPSGGAARQMPEDLGPAIRV